MSNKIDVLTVSRYLLIGILIGMLFSPPIVNLFEIILYGLFLFSPILRKAFIGTVKEPLGFMVLLFSIIIIIGVFYSAAPLDKAAGEVWGWRKILLTPMALAVFGDDTWKLKAIYALIWTTLFALVLSYATFYLPDIQAYNKYSVGIIIRNHATQGMIFSVVAFSAMVLSISVELTKAKKYFLQLIAFLLIINIIYITPGRSGYLALLLLVTIFSWYMSRKKIHYLSVLIAPMLVLFLLYLSPTAHTRIHAAFMGLIDSEQQVDSVDNKKISDLSVRKIFWVNSLKIIKQKPWFGYGTAGFSYGYDAMLDHKNQFRTHDPHNQFLKITAEHGIIGLLIFLSLIVAFFYQRNNQNYLYLLGVSIVLVWCATSMASAHFSTFTEGRFVFLWGAILLVSTINLKEK